MLAQSTVRHLHPASRGSFFFLATNKQQHRIKISISSIENQRSFMILSKALLSKCLTELSLDFMSKFSAQTLD